MLVGFRNTILVGGILFTLLVLLTLLVGVYLIFTGNFNLEVFTSLQSNTWWFTYQILGENPAHLWVLVSIFIMFALILISGLVLRVLFKKTASPELFFFIIFLFSFAFEGFRILNVLFYFKQAPLYLILFNSRLVYFGRIFGTLLLFCSSLYAVELKYQKFDIIIGIAALSALVLAYSLPLDSSSLLTNFLYRLGDESSIFFIISSFALFTVINFLIASFKRISEFLPIMLAILCALCGRELLLYVVNPLMILIGLVLIISGTLVFSKQIDKIYLWI